ncbi:MAG TPA: hypothetical protein DEA08_10475, partial [Planctomycetes bacterium]|nr:hypothetical protein [Planctomycetota bacterium]
SLTFTARGTVDETIFSRVLVCQDDNDDGILDASELAAPEGTAQPGFPSNDGTLTVALGTGVTVAAGSSTQFFVVLDGTGITTTKAMIGQTVDIRVTSAAAIGAVDASNSQAITPTGNFTDIFGPVRLGIHDHLLISEVAYFGTEFIEIFNPTPLTVAINAYHLTDSAFTGGAVQNGGTGTNHKYWLLPTGDGFGPAAATNTSDFSVRFPANAQMAPGEVIVVAIDGTDFNAVYGAGLPAGTQVFALRDVATGQTQMRTWDGAALLNFAQNPVSAQVTLTDTGEGVILFFWQGQAALDLVTDIDYVFWVAAGDNGTNTRTVKTGEMVDGPDGGAVNVAGDTSTFNMETASGSQARIGATNSTSIERTNYNEGNENQANGNGVGGDDETSEDWNNTFRVTTAATPGRVP